MGKVHFTVFCVLCIFQKIERKLKCVNKYFLESKNLPESNFYTL